MYPELFSCCKDVTQNIPWIFVYENSDIYSICETHFTSDAHRAFVKYVINMKTKKTYLPNEIFEEVLLENEKP